MKNLFLDSVNFLFGFFTINLQLNAAERYKKVKLVLVIFTYTKLRKISTLAHVKVKLR